MHLPDAQTVAAEAAAARAAIGPECTDDDLIEACGTYIWLFAAARAFPHFKCPDVEWLARYVISQRTRKPH